MDTIPLYQDDEWPYVLTLLPEDLEASAKTTNALVRQRNIPNAAALMRLALAYAVSDLSLKDVAAWASAVGIATITGPGLFYRLRESEHWLEYILAATLESEIARPPLGVRLRVVDATVINGPGATGTQWRAHVLVNPVSGGIESVELTDNHGGEGYGRHPLNAGDVVLGDRAYATARGIYSVLQANAHVVVRLNPHTIRMCDSDHCCISLLLDMENVPKVGVKEYKIIIPVPPEKKSKSHKTWKLEDAIAWVPARVIASRTRSGDVIWILTTIFSEEWTPDLILILYRFRWQIEILFKRLKSLLHIDTLPSREGPTAKSWMLSRFIAAAIIQKLTTPSGVLSPWGYELRRSRVYT